MAPKASGGRIVVYLVQQRHGTSTRWSTVGYPSARRYVAHVKGRVTQHFRVIAVNGYGRSPFASAQAKAKRRT